MKSKIIVNQLKDIDAISTAHLVGEKKVLITKENCDSNLMQAAIGKLKSGEKVALHQHKTMEEFYYFKEGRAVFTIKNVDFPCESGTFIKVPIATEHSLEALEDVKFIYWGVAI